MLSLFTLLHLPTLLLNQTATLLYPLYASYKTLSSPTPQLADQETWLIYWAVFACISFIESIVGWTWSWLPFYYELRLIFYLWLVLPQTKGASHIYIHHLHPLLVSQQQNIDSLIDTTKQQLGQHTSLLIDRLWITARADPPPPPPTTTTAATTTTTTTPSTQIVDSFKSGTLVSSFLSRLTPYAAAATASLLEKAQAKSSSYASSPSTTTTSSLFHRGRDPISRRKELERQLSFLDRDFVSDTDSSPPPPPPPSQQQQPFPTSSSSSQKITSLAESYDLLDQFDFSPSSASSKKKRS